MAAIQETLALFNIFEEECEEIENLIPFVCRPNIIQVACCIPDLGEDVVMHQKVGNFSELVAQMSEVQFKKNFRLSRPVFEALFCKLNFHERENAGGSEQTPQKKKLQIYIWYMSNQDTMREIAILFGISEHSVHDIIRELSRSICELGKTVISWPDRDRQNEISEKFQDRRGIPGIIGAIDGTHIKIVNIPGEKTSYFNRKGWYSMQLQLVVDNTLLITDAYTGWPGSTHDARVFRNSPLFAEAENGERRFGGRFIIGDSAYPLKHWIITPFRDNGHLTRQQLNFNTRLSMARQVVERAIAHMKGRFRRLREINCRSSENICYLIMSACVLHNLCVKNDDDIDSYNEPSEDDVDVDVDVDENGDIGGTARRKGLALSLR